MLTAPLRRPWLVPVVAYGSYYAGASWKELTQLEILVSAPIYFCLWAGYRRDERSWVAWCSGVAVGVVAAFKLVLTPLPILLLLAGYRQFRQWRAIAGGVLTVLAPMTAWLLWSGGFEQYVWTTFIFPPQGIKANGPLDGGVLLGSLGWFATHFAPWLLLGALAMPLLVRLRDRFLVLAAAWIAIGFALIGVQVLSGWPYHFELLMLPVALLAVAWLDRLPDRWAVAAVVVGLLSYAPIAIKKIRPLTAAAVLGDAEGGRQYRRAISPEYRQAWNETRFLAEPNTSSGPIYVLGNPLYI